MAAGSLSALLHGSRGSGRTPLDWDTRMKIALGAARGLACLHVSGKLVHGNIKSSNILLHPTHEACVSDFGLNPIFANPVPSNRVAGYRAPEVQETKKITFKSDVYSFGVLMLELLTGKAPNQASLSEEGIDLPRWVQSVVREEWTAEVFDAELMRYHNIEEEMVQLLQIAMTCVSLVPDQRPNMDEVVHMIQDISRSETTDDGLRQSSDDPSKGSDGHTPPQDARTTPRSDTS
ncbi:Putative inactive receptor kinase [Glycine soja]|nr:Putative inactive receptor kinase [Glycine soja]